MEDIRERVRANIETVIASSHLTKTAIAEYLEVTPACITNWVKGRNSPDLEKLIKFCEMFDLSLDDIYSDELVLGQRDRDAEKERLLSLYNQLNLTGRMKLIDIADDLVLSGKYEVFQPKSR